MSVAIRHDWWISPEKYLRGEEMADTKHEYVGGMVYAMAGARNIHNLLATRVLTELGGQLRGRSCEPFNSDTKVRIRRGSDVRFYYPDVMVVCDSYDPDEVFQDKPVVIFEVISPSTERTDHHEKLHAYQSIDSLRAYVIVESERVAFTCYQRGDSNADWTSAAYVGHDARLTLAAIDCTLELKAVYARTGL